MVQLATNYLLYADESRAVYKKKSTRVKADGGMPESAYRPPVKVLIGLQ